ncbi:MAG TPA: hypothetical protein PLT93_21200, partial [Phycisphaerae bacterium]|nr:hypothetical protein [Phycisphaerae bacterium]
AEEDVRGRGEQHRLKEGRARDAPELRHRRLLGARRRRAGAAEVVEVEPDYDFWETGIFNAPGWPKLHFIEHKYANDETNWWVPNLACSQAMLRSAGFEILSHPEPEVFVCRRREMPDGPDGPRPVYAARRSHSS